MSSDLAGFVLHCGSSVLPSLANAGKSLETSNGGEHQAPAAISEVAGSSRCYNSRHLQQVSSGRAIRAETPSGRDGARQQRDVVRGSGGAGPSRRVRGKRRREEVGAMETRRRWKS